MISSLESVYVKNSGKMNQKDFTRNCLLIISLMVLISLNNQ